MTDLIQDELAIQPEIEKNYRWNFLVNSLNGASFSCGMSFFSSAIILPLFVSHFTKSPMAIGLISFLGWAGALLPPLFMANWVERTPLKKFFPVKLGFFAEHLPMLLLAPLTFLLAVQQPTLTLVLFFVLYTWSNIGDGMVSVGWQDMIAKIIPTEKRGLFFGITNFIGNGTGLLGALAVLLVLEKYAFPLGFVICFAAAGGLFFLSWIFVSLTREPAVVSHKPPVSQLDYLRSLPEVLQKDRNFRMYLLTQIIFALSGMATGFLAVYSVQTWNLSDAKVGAFGAAMQIGLVLGNLLFGFFADRKGHKLSLEICFGLSLLALILAVVAPGVGWFFVIFLLRGVVDAGSSISGFAIVYEFAGAEKRPTYIGLSTTIPGIVSVIAPLTGGWLAGVLNYPVMFTLAAVTGALSWGLLHFTVREPRQAQPPVPVDG